MRISDWSSDVCSSDLTRLNLSDDFCSVGQYVGFVDPDMVETITDAIDQGREKPVARPGRDCRERSGDAPGIVHWSVLEIGRSRQAPFAGTAAGEGEDFMRRGGNEPRCRLSGILARLDDLRSEEHTSELQSLMR